MWMTIYTVPIGAEHSGEGIFVRRSNNTKALQKN